MANVLLAVSLAFFIVLDSTAQPLPRKGGQREEAVEGVDIRYGEVRTDKGYRVRTYTSRPRGALLPPEYPDNEQGRQLFEPHPCPSSPKRRSTVFSSDSLASIISATPPSGPPVDDLVGWSTLSLLGR